MLPTRARGILPPMTHAERAVSLFTQGYNCAQSTAAAFADEFGLSKEEILKIMAGFGGGIGGLRGTCGAVSGMAFIAGLALGEYEPEDNEAKTRLYAEVQGAHGEFLEEFGTDSCRELLDRAGCDYSAVPSVRTPEYYASRPCARFIGAGAAIIARRLGLEAPADGKDWQSAAYGADTTRDGAPGA